jgi:hypothetical protein
VHKRYPLAVFAVIGLAATAGPVSAEPASEPTGPPAGPTETVDAPVHPATDSFTLPTGDEIRLTPDGLYRTEPVEGGAGAFKTAVEPDGDRLVIPVEALSGIAAGDFTFEQFNIDALARNGITDANNPAARSLLAAETEPEPAAETVSVDFTALWSDGSAPEVVYLQFLDLETDFYKAGIITEGTGTIPLPVGHYHVMGSMVDNSQDASIDGLLDVVVDEDGEKIVLNGAPAKTAAFATDREAVPVDKEFSLFSYVPGSAEGLSSGHIAGGAWKSAVIPVAAGMAGRDIGMTLAQELVNPESAARPYSYSLYEWTTDGVSANPVFRVRDRDLARIEMEYQSLGADAHMYRSNYAAHALYPRSGYLGSSDVVLPSKRTEFYSADPELAWYHQGSLAEEEPEDEPDAADEEGLPTDFVLHSSRHLKPGKTTGMTWNEGPITVGVDLAGALRDYPLLYRMESDGVLWTRPAMFSNGAADQAIISQQLPGQTVLSQNGLGINKSQSGGDLITDLALVPAGTYRLYSEAHRAVPWTPLGIASTVEWEFTTAPSEQNTYLDVSVVNFDAEGIENGYAEADEDQDVELEYLTQPGAEQRECTSMTFEVSYDDGETWEEVEIDREGNRAEAELEHPEGAAFVSVRFSATDEAGNRVTHSTIRSYGLR